MTKEQLHEKYPWSVDRITYPGVWTSYREPTNSGATCMLSLFTVHNELVNSWTHIGGVALAVALLVYTIYTVTPSGGEVVLVIYCFLGLAMFCSSSSYHTFSCHSDSVSGKVLCVDWLGVTGLIFGTTLLGSWYELKGYPFVFAAFTVVNLLLGAFTYATTYMSLQKMMSPKSDVKRYAMMDSFLFRMLACITYAFGLVIAWITGYLLTGVANNDIYIILAVYACYSTVICNMFNFPECLFPKGTLDIVGWSHQIFHCGIVIGFFVAWYGFYSIEMAQTCV